MKKLRLIAVLIFIVTVISTLFNIQTTTLNKNTKLVNYTASTKSVFKEETNRGIVYYANELYANTTETSKIEHNTKYLQQLVDTVSKIGGGTVRIPAGIYYFASAGANSRKYEDYVIKAKNNVLIEGAGINENNYKECTILKPYGELKESKNGGIDMFYYNEYADSNYTKATYLENADFKNFIIDGSETKGKGYNSSGKGFMFLLVKNCDYENIIVRNTEATGFGMDCPINCTITNCIAIDCGRSAKPTDVGASGFGIGTGYSNKESIHISNCKSYGNKKYGFFFEHQGRFCGTKFELFPATKSKGFVVSNCVASGNMYDFGGARANDVTYENCTSNNSYVNNNVKNMSSLYFESMSRRVHIVNCNVEQKFTDVTDDSLYYYKPVYWALNNAITNGVSKTEFRPKENASRAEAVVLLWRMAERPGDVVYSTGKILHDQFENIYDDVPGDAYYVDAVKWAKDEKIISSSKNFGPNKAYTRAEFITMLWKYAGKPTVTIKNKFKDIPAEAEYIEAVNWAASKGILKGTSETTFSPNKKCSRAEVITFLYRYANTKNTFSITYNLNGGISGNPTEYKAGKDSFILKAPKKSGYTFLGWTGSNYKNVVNAEKYEPKKTAKITRTDVGNKAYTANWIPNNYTITFKANGGSGKMSKEYFTYDSPQTLSSNKFTRKNYTFKGWTTRVDGKGKLYKDGQAVKNLTTKSNGKITLYAQWEKNSNNFTINKLLKKFR